MNEPDKTRIEDRRAEKRRSLTYYLTIYDRTTDRVLGKLVDISTKGIMVTSDHPLPVGRVFQMRMVLPPEFTDRKYLVFDGRSIWCREDLVNGQCGTGFRLIDATARERDLIRRLIEEFGT